MDSSQPSGPTNASSESGFPRKQSSLYDDEDDHADNNCGGGVLRAVDDNDRHDDDEVATSPQLTTTRTSTETEQPSASASAMSTMSAAAAASAAAPLRRVAADPLAGGALAPRPAPAPAPVPQKQQHQQQQPRLDPSQVRNSFTSDTPYFGGFVEKESRGVQLLGEELHNIGSKAQTLIRTGQLYGEAARRFATACRLRRDLPSAASSNGNASGGANGGDADYSSTDEDERVAEEEAVLQRRQAMGDEMVRLFSLLGEVRCVPMRSDTSGIPPCLDLSTAPKTYHRRMDRPADTTP
jgi:hypothetical protein